MAFDPNSLLIAQELTTPRTTTQLAQWVEEKCRLFASHNEAKEWALLHKGVFKKFYEEVYPLSLFATHLYAGRSDIQCIPNLDYKDFDAVIIDSSTSPPSELKVEITSALDEKEGHDKHLRMEYFVQHGEVNVWGTLSASGTKKSGHQIHIENEAIDRNDLLKQTFSLIRSAIERKSVRHKEPQKYGQGHILIVAFEDWQWFEPDKDIPALKYFMKQHVLTLPLNFADLYVLGLSGKTFVCFKLTKIQDSTT
jgi:hypothetical protein